MKAIKRIVNMIDEELDGAQCYAEMAIEKKAEDSQKWYGRFKSMSEDELAHAMLLHEYAVEEIEKLNKVYQAPQEMIDKWEEAHKDYVQRASWIKGMINL